MYDIESIQALYANHAVIYTQHFRERMKERDIKFADVRMAIHNGQIVEQNVQDMPNPSVLILGYVRDARPLHVVVGMDDSKLVMITVYVPAPSHWEADNKTRKAAK